MVPEPTVEEDHAARWTVDAALAVHKGLGPGLKESHYREALVLELARRGLRVEQEVSVPAYYDGIPLSKRYQLDLRVNGILVVEVKAKGAIHPRDVQQTLNYLAATRHRLALLLNFGGPRMIDGIRRIIRSG